MAIGPNVVDDCEGMTEEDYWRGMDEAMQDEEGDEPFCNCSAGHSIEETMEYTAKLPTEVGLYRHRWNFRGQMREQVLFVGYTNVRAPRLQGSEPNAYMPRKLKCCKPDEHLHADRLTPKEWGGWWARIETPNAD